MCNHAFTLFDVLCSMERNKNDCSSFTYYSLNNIFSSQKYLFGTQYVLYQILRVDGYEELC